jgi:hypothetical protein
MVLKDTVSFGQRLINKDPAIVAGRVSRARLPLPSQLLDCFRCRYLRIARFKRSGELKLSSNIPPDVYHALKAVGRFQLGVNRFIDLGLHFSHPLRGLSGVCEGGARAPARDWRRLADDLWRTFSARPGSRMVPRK